MSITLGLPRCLETLELAVQFDKDMSGCFGDVFARLRGIILSFDEIGEVKNAKQTSYRDRYNRVICMLRANETRVVVALGHGAKLQETYPSLIGEGKIVRQLHYRCLEEIDEPLLREIILESLVLGMEAYEMRLIKNSLK